MKRRTRIGLFVRNLDEEYHLSVFAGVKERARSHCIDLVCVQGESIDARRDAGLPLFPLSRYLRLDGAIILGSTMIEESRRGDSGKIASAFAHIPIISIGTRIPGLPCVLTQTRKPMANLMDHLIDVHGYRRFLYIGGPERNRDNMTREGEFRKSLERLRSRGEKAEATVISGDRFLEYAGFTAIRDYAASHPERDVDVIVAASDNIAIGALRVIREFAGSSWAGCPVTGFDDIPQSAREDPPLTTIRQPLHEMGERAIDAVFAMIRGGQSSPSVTVNASFIKRESCGCKAQSKSATADADNAANWHLLRDVGALGQELSLSLDVRDMLPPLERFLIRSRVRSFKMILFPKPSAEVPEKGRLVFDWGRSSQGLAVAQRAITPHAGAPEGAVDGEEPMGRSVSLTPTLSQNRSDRKGERNPLIVFPLKAGHEYLGLIAYDSDEADYPYLCNCGAFLANAVKRTQVLEGEKLRARQLEAEVASRTADLVKANARLRREAARREAVEREVLRISDLERMRFSMELHDDICQRLAGIAMLSKGLSAANPRMQEVATIAVETLQKTREYAQNSFPFKLGAFGLNESLSQLCESLSRQSGVPFRYSWSAGGASPFTPEQELNIYRIVQEALHNVVRHSGASEAEVSVAAEKSSYAVRIRDNGTGASGLGKGKKRKGPGRDASGLGMRSMEYRAHQLGARFSVTSSKAGGTEILVSIPR